jgi:hypothetical protein
MVSRESFDERVLRVSRLVVTMLDECRDAEAAVMLFSLHKLHLDEWTLIRERLFGICYCPSRLSRISNVLSCSCSSSLFGWEHLIPGLDQFLIQPDPIDLFD